MPTLRIMSIYRQRKQEFAAELCHAHSELEEFRIGLAARFGAQFADAIRRQRWRPKGKFPGNVGLPRLSKDRSLAAKKFQALQRKLRVVQRKIRTPDCWFRESPGIVSVLQMTGLSWREVHERCADKGRLPISGVLRLLSALRTAEAQEREWVATGADPRDLSEKWRQRLTRGRRRLAMLLQTAAVLEEDVKWQYRL